MKKYSEYSDEITSDEIYDGLLGYGLFAEKIPNFLTSEEFLNYTKTLTTPITSCKDKDYIRYSSIRNINVPRSLAIPEPFAYTNHCRSISDNWTELQQHFRDKTTGDDFKISRIHLRKMVGKSHFFEMNYKNFTIDGEPEQEIIIHSKYIACADISSCFPSIYSHSISWALIGKSNAKMRHNRAPSLWFNQIDMYVRNIKYGETNGLLIGPHASNLISEIILVSVDYELVRKGYKYIRNIDDYTCYVDSYEKAESFLLDLSEELKKYELTLNNKKSKISPLPKASVENWVTKLNHFNFTNTYIHNQLTGIRVKELKGFIDFAIELMLENNSDSSIINYAIKILSNKILGKKAKDYLIKQIHHLVLLYPYLVNILEKDVFEAHNIDKITIKKIAIDIYYLGIRRKIYEACSYSVYWAMKYNFTTGIDVLKRDSIDSNDCIFMLVSYLYDKKNNRRSYLKEYKDYAKVLKVNDFDRYWLYIYEVLPHSELPVDYRNMKGANITFIKPEFI